MHKVDPATFDPVEPIAFAVLYLLLTGLVTYVYINLGLVHLLVFLRGLLCCCAGYLGWTVHCAVTTARRCSAAVQHLPGPDLGHLGLLKILSQRADWHCALTEMADTYGPIYQARALFFRFVVVTDPVLALHCLRLPTSNIDKWGFGYSWLQKLLGGANVLTGQSDKHWRSIRKGVAPAFSATRMRDACKGITATAEQLVQILQDQGGKAFNIDIFLLRAGIDYVGSVGFGKEMGGLDAAQADANVDDDEAASMMRAGHELGYLMKDPLRAFKLWQSDVWRGMYNHYRYQGICKGIVTHIKEHKPPAGSFAELLLGIINPATGRPYQKRLISESSTLFSAAADTTAHTITWALYQISVHPEVEARIIAELSSLGLAATPEAPVPRSFSAADLSKLPYLTLVIKETLRMHPAIGVGQLRVCAKDTDLAGHLKLPAGTVLWVPHHAMQNSHLNWDQPNVFMPERFEQPGVEQPDPSKLALPPSWYKAMGYDPATSGASMAKRYLPFGEGPRSCLGQNLAHTSMLTILAVLLGRLKFQLADQMGGQKGVKAREMFSIVTAVQDGMWMHAEARA